MYFLAKHISFGDDGWGPPFTNVSHGWCMLIEPPNRHSYALYQSEDLYRNHLDGGALPVGVEAVTPALSGLLAAATQYYLPALVLTQKEINALRHVHSEPLTVDDFLKRVESLLQKHLYEHPLTPYFLARATAGHLDLEAGHWYWILTYDSRDESVTYIHDIHYVRTGPATAFEVTRDELKKLEANCE